MNYESQSRASKQQHNFLAPQLNIDQKEFFPHNANILYDIPTSQQQLRNLESPSTNIGQSLLVSSNIRGFFHREQMSREELFRQNEFKRKTREILDQQIEEKRAFQSMRSKREIEIEQLQTRNQLKIVPSPSSPQGVIGYPSAQKIALHQITEEYNKGRIQSRHSHSPRRPEANPQLDFNKLKEIIHENEQLKQHINQKQQLIKQLLQQSKSQNIRQKALMEIQEADQVINYSITPQEQAIQKSGSSPTPTANILQKMGKFKNKIIFTSKIRKQQPITKGNPNSSSQDKIKEQIRFGKQIQNSQRVIVTTQVELEKKKQNSIRVTSQKNIQNSRVAIQLGQSYDNKQILQSSLQTEVSKTLQYPENNFTFANNMTEKLQLSIQERINSKQGLKLKLMKEFSQDNLKKKFFV